MGTGAHRRTRPFRDADAVTSILSARTRTGRDRDDGAGSIELIGILTIAALLVTTVLVSVRALDAKGHTSAALCAITRAFGIGGCDSDGAPRSPEDYLPPEQCVLTADGGSVGVSASALLTGGANGDWLIEQLGDGTYRLTRGAGLEGGASVGIGFDVSVTGDGHRYGVGASAGAGAAATFKGGEVFHVTSLDEAKKVLTSRNVDTVKDAVVGDGGPGRWVVDKVHGIWGDTSNERRTPDEVYVAGGLKGEGSAVLNATLGNAGAQASVEQVLGVRTRPDGSSTAYFSSAASLSGDLQGIEPGPVPGRGTYAELSGRLEGEYVLEVDYDKNGKATALTVRSTYVVDGTSESGHASRADFADPDVVNEIAFSLPLRDAADRRLAAGTLHAAGIPWVPGVSDGVDLGAYALDRLTPWDSITKFGVAAMQDGQVWRQASTRESSEYGINFDAELLAKVGVSANLTTTQRRIQSYEYWNGQEFASRPGCGL